MTRPPARPGSRRATPRLDVLEGRVAPAGVVNGDFAVADPASFGFGFSLRGNAYVQDGQAVLAEGTTTRTGLSQVFVVPAGTTSFRFTLVASNLVSNGAGQPPDAFEAALLDAQTLAPLVGPATGLPNTDAFLNVQATGEVFVAPGVSVPGAGASGEVAALMLPLIVTVDLSGVAAGTQALVAFDLLGFDAASSAVRIDDLQALQGPALPSVHFGLAPASDSGAPGDGLTRFNPVDLAGTTDPDQAVSLDVDGDGFDDGTTTADASGHFTFAAVPLVEGSNTLRVRATNGVGATTATQSVVVDTQRPSGSLVAPADGASVDQDPGFIEVQWSDPGAAGIDPSSFDVSDVTISDVDIDRVEDLGGGRVRYRYGDDGDRLSAGPVSVVLVADGVSDRAANLNAQAAQTFTLTSPIPSNHAPLAATDAFALDEGETLVVDAARGLLSNDSDPDADRLRTTLDSDVAHGTLALRDDGSFTYMPAPGYLGPDAFSYRASDGSLASDPATVRLVVSPLPSALQFEAGSYRVAEGAGAAVVTVVRTGGPAAAVAVNYATGGGTATGGVDYTPISGTLRFGPGVTRREIRIPLRDDSLVEPDETIVLALTDAEGAMLGAASTTITIADDDQMSGPSGGSTNNPGATGPHVTGVTRFGFHFQPTAYVVAFDEALDPARAQSIANYTLSAAGRDGRLGTPDDRPVRLASATYDPAARAVILRPVARLDVHRTYRLRIAGTAVGVTDLTGNLLDGDGDGRPGGDSTALVGRRDLAGPAAMLGPIVGTGDACAGKVGSKVLSGTVRLGARRARGLGTGPRTVDLDSAISVTP